MLETMGRHDLFIAILEQKAFVATVRVAVHYCVMCMRVATLVMETFQRIVSRPLRKGALNDVVFHVRSADTAA